MASRCGCRMARPDSIDWWEDRNDRPLERSACVACPFRSLRRWVEIMRRWPELFAEAVETDAGMRHGLAFARVPYLNPRRIPLAEAVRLDQAEMAAGLVRDTASSTSARGTAASHTRRNCRVI